MKDKLYEENPFKGPFGSLENLADKIRDILHCPVTIEDVNHRLLSYSSHDNHTDVARVNTIIQRRVPEKVINRLWQEGIILKLMQTEEPVRIPGIKDIGLGDRVAVSIRKNHEVIGYLWIVEDELLTDEQLILLKKAADSARSELMQVHARKKKKEEGYQEFFWQLLTGHYTTHEDALNKFEELNINAPSQFAVLAFKFDKEITQKIEQKLSYIFKGNPNVIITFYVVVQKEIILIASPSSLKPSLVEKTLVEFINLFINEMKSKFQVDYIAGSSGTIYEVLNKVEKSYQEALEVIRLKEKFKHDLNDIYSYPQLGILRYLDVLLEKRRKDSFEHPAVDKLFKYDKLNKTNLLETLEVYINNDSNVNEASKKLHVHTNTLNYRLKRMADIADIDLKNANEKMSLYLELKLKRLEKSTRL